MNRSFRESIEISVAGAGVAVAVLAIDAGLGDSERLPAGFRIGIAAAASISALFFLRNSLGVWRRKIAGIPSAGELKKLEHVFESASWGMSLSAPDGRFIAVNPAFARMHGGTRPEEWIGRSTIEAFAEESKAQVPELRRRIDETGEVSYESIHVRKDGSRFPVLTEASSFRDESGRVIFRAANFFDITERKRIEDREKEHQAQLEATFQAMRDGVLVFDLEGRLVLANESNARILGYANVEDLRRNLAYYTQSYELRYLDGGVVPADRWPIARVIQGETISEVELLSRRLDNGKEWVFSFSGQPIRDATGKQVLATIVTRDVTLQKRAERDMREAIRARDEFLSVASHELKTPLSSLVLLSETVRRRTARKETDAMSPEAFDRFLVQSDRHVARVERVVNDMLDITRMRTGQLTLAPERVEVSRLVDGVIERAQPLFSDEGVALACSSRVSATGTWDPIRIEQVLTNLLTNALRYGERAPVEVGIALLPGSRQVAIRVRDRGMGIASGDIERIFERFERAVDADEVSGLGLGLYIARQIAEAHGGRLWVESEKGSGSTFHLELPIDPATDRG
jgi:PAS domain S-box-containing protein